jgi:hypothetical protein
MAYNPQDVEITRMKYALIIAISGIVVSASLVLLLVFGAGMRSSADIVAIVGAFTGVSGTLVGTFLGLQVGSSGREQERNERRVAEKKINMALGMLNEQQAEKVMDMDTSP